MDIIIEEVFYIKNNIRNYVWVGDLKFFVIYFEEKVNNDGGFFVWVVGNRKGVIEINLG